MSVVAVSMVRDEADIVAFTFGHLLTQVDHILVADNGSTDGTRETLTNLGCEVVDDPELGYRQAEKMTALAHRAREQGAAWVLPVDADEWWRATDGRPIREVLAELPKTANVVEARLWNHIATGDDPGDTDDPVRRMQWRLPDAAPLPKVACRALPGLEIAQGNHSATYSGKRLNVVGWLLEVHHFSNRSPGQMVRKVRNGAAAYAATDLPQEMGRHWREWGKLLEERGPEAIKDLFRTWWWRADPEAEVVIEGERQPPLVYDPCASP